MSVYVVKRDGRKESFSVEKVKKVISWAVNASDVNPLVLESKFNQFIRDGITTEQIHENLIYHARILCRPEEPEWSFVAGRLETMKHWKKTSIFEKTFSYYFKEQVENGNYTHPGLDVWTKTEIQSLGKIIVQERDLDHSYGSVLTALKKYLLPGECIQQMHMVNAMIIASVEEKAERVAFASKVYEALSKRKISLATPWLSNLRCNKNISSCFIIQVGDSMESIAEAWKKAALISKHGGGLGIDFSLIRASKSAIGMQEGASKGITSWVKIFNDIAVAVDQGGKRAGAFTVHCPIWHRDIEDFLELQTEQGDFRKKSFDVFPQVGVYDLFMKEQQAEDGGTWHTFCPDEVKRKLGFTLTGNFGKEFETRYRVCVRAFKAGKLKNVGIYNAKALLKSIMKIQFETGLPYIAFLDRMNEANPNDHEGYIPCTNLCVAPETKILTDAGYKTISELKNKSVNVWNGQVFSEVTVRKTGENQKLIRVKTSSGQSIDCTEYHKFYVQNGYGEEPVEKQARELVLGDKLIKFDLPVIEGEATLSQPYSNGFFTADGHTTYGHSFIYLYGEKRALSHLFEAEGYDNGWRHEDAHDRTRSNSFYGLREKFFVPGAEFRISDRLTWLAGFLDGDGVVARNGENESIQAASINFEFLSQVQLMLQTLGVQSKITKLHDRRTIFMPDGRGGQEEYECQPIFRLLISSTGLMRLSQLGFVTHRLKWSARSPQRCAEQFSYITAVIDDGRVDDTYCFNEPLRHMGMFNGLLTGQCTESFSNVKADEFAHTCNLASIVIGRCEDKEEIYRLSRLCCHILDNGIEMTKAPIKDSSDHNFRYRTIGIGIQGLHDWVAKEGMLWNDYRGFTEIAEIIEYGAVCESVDIAERRGAYPAFENSQWFDGRMRQRFEKNTVSNFCDWNSVFDKMAKTGIRNSQLTSPAPNTSTGPFMDASPSIMPVYRAFYNEDNKTGKFSVFGMYIKQFPLAYERTQPRQDQAELTKLVGAMQKFIDTGISAEYVIDLNKEGASAKILYDLINSAWRNKNKAIYYIRSIKAGATIDDVVGGETVCSGCAG